MNEEIFDHIRALCRLMSEAGLSELEAAWRDTRIFLRSERAAQRPPRPLAAAAAPASLAHPAHLAPAADRGLIEIRSPLLGIFYRAPAPDRPPFVEVGDLIEEGQTVAVVEAMKVINDIVADAGGRVVEICVDNGHLVGEGDVLMRLARA
jgi:acetyl-CoA carboxylase biotin carboxyl carrier protein